MVCNSGEIVTKVCSPDNLFSLGIRKKELLVLLFTFFYDSPVAHLTARSWSRHCLMRPPSGDYQSRLEKQIRYALALILVPFHSYSLPKNINQKTKHACNVYDDACSLPLPFPFFKSADKNGKNDQTQNESKTVLVLR